MGCAASSSSNTSSDANAECGTDKAKEDVVGVSDSTPSHPSAGQISPQAPNSSDSARGVTPNTNVEVAQHQQQLHLEEHQQSKPKIALDSTKFQPFKLVSKKEVSHDTRILRFALQSPEHVLGLPIGQHMYLKAMVDGAEVQRAYTPISSDDDLGYFELLIKVYFKNVHPKFPEGGKLTQHLEAMKVGDEILVKGPSGRFEYLGHSKFSVTKPRGEPIYRRAKAFGMIAGGSGITPMYQIIKAILKNPADPTLVYLLFANQTEADILLRGELDAMTKDPRVKVWYTLDRPEAGWPYSAGFINEEMLKANMPPADGESVILMCGPPPMVNFACKPNLEKLGFTADDMFTF